MRPRTVHVSIDINSGVRRFSVSSHEKPASPRKRPLGGRVVRFATLILIVSVTAFATGIFKTHANTVYFYPSVCLGGWADTQFAERAPNALEGTWITKHNAAYLASTSAAQIFCGRFYGDTPEETTPTKVRAKLFLAELGQENNSVVPVSNVSFPEESNVPIETETATSSEKIENNVGTSTENSIGTEIESEVSSSTEPVPLDEESGASEEEQPPLETIETTEETSWWHFLLPIAHAEEIATSSEEVATTTLIVQETASSTEPFEIEDESTVATTSIEKNLLQEKVIEEETGTTTEEVRTASLDEFENSTTTATTSEEGIVAGVTSSADGDPFLEVSVSIAGGARTVVDVISRNEFDSAEFDIPLPEGFAWADFEQFEISIERVAALGDQPDILLDGIQLAVSYEPISKDSGVSVTLLDRLTDAITPEVETATSTADVATSTATSTQVITEEIIGPLPEREITLETVLDPNAQHSCKLSEFPISMSSRATSTASVTLQGIVGKTAGLTIGSLPRGIDIVFSENGEHEYSVPTQARDVPLSITRFYGAQKGIFSIPIVYTLHDVQSSVECQIVIDNS